MNLEVMSARKNSKHQKKSSEDQSRGQLADVTEVWLICAPGDKTPKATWDAVNKATAKNLSTNFKFHTPELKVGISICIALNIVICYKVSEHVFLMQFLSQDFLFCECICLHQQQ